MAKTKQKKAKSGKHPGGRPTKYKPEYADLAFKFCLLKATDEQLAKFFDVPTRTIDNWKKRYPEFLQAIKRGKEEADARVSESLYDRAMGYEHEDVDIRVVQNKIVKTKIIKHYPPDPTSMIFWLKNRQPQTWRDKHDLEHSGKDGGPIIVEIQRFTDGPENKNTK